MTRTSVTSSNLVSVGHCPDTNTLEVEFKGGAVYQYAEVDADAHKRLMEAASLGSHLHHHIKDRFVAKRVA